MTYTIYEGLWIDWMRGRWLGATITLSQADGALLLAFIATFVTVVSIRLWRIVSFTLHQIYASQTAHDGLHFQRQHTLRNTTSPAAAFKFFLLQLWHWRQAKGVVWRTLPLAFFSLLYIGVFAVLAVFSSRVSDGASTSRLISPSECGVWNLVENRSEIDMLQTNMEKTAYDVTKAVGMARSCYSSNATSLSCNISPVSMLQSDASEVSCPFGDNICFEGKAFEVKARPIDSRLHLGINARSEDRVIYDRQLTCAPLITKGYGQFVNDTDGTPTHIQYFYGAQGTLETENKPNHTYEYPLARKAAKISYQVEVHEHRVGGGPWWSPIEALSRSEGDMFIIFIEQNSVRHWKPNQDPVFRANKSVTLSETPMFESERYVSPIACYQQHRFCTPDHESCTSWGGRYEMLNITTKRPSGFTPTQLATASRLFFAALSTSIYETINSRPSMCLRAQDKMYWLYQMPLPDNQWQHEILSWAQEGLASLQAAVQEYAAGPSIALEGGYMKRMWHEKIPDNYVSSDRVYDKTWESMCHSQIVHDTQGTLNFALLGIAVILGLGILITILSFVIEPFTALVQRRFNVGATRADAWQRDESLQSLRLLFEKYNRGIWRGHSDLVPVTINANETFFYPLAHGIVEDSYQSLPNKEDDKSGRITA